MNTRVLLIFILIMWGLSSYSQESVVFQQPEADLGTIIDNQGVVDHQFTFVNQASKGVQVDRVTASCGCTSTDWSAVTIEPGDQGFVAVQFDPNNRPGPFEKYVTVHFKDQPDSAQLTIKGFVKPASTTIEEEFPIQMGALRVKQRVFDLGTITTNSLFSKSYEVYNQGNQILIFSDDMAGPNHITVTFEPYTLKPRSTGKIWVHYDVMAKNDLGFFNEDISIFTYEETDTRKDFSVTTTLLDAPPPISPESPRIQFDRTEIDFGVKEQGDTVNASFQLRNIGQSTLRLKKVFGNCNCIKVQSGSQEVKAGSLAEISVQFFTDERIGNQDKTVTVFTDDPLMPVAILKLKGRLRGSRD